MKKEQKRELSEHFKLILRSKRLTWRRLRVLLGVKDKDLSLIERIKLAEKYLEIKIL